MKALVFEESLPRFAAARLAGSLAPGLGAKVGPLRLADADEPVLPGTDWVRVRPRLAGICGSDLASVDGRSSPYFEALVSFPFTPGHEVVGDLDDDTRVVVEPVLSCASRGIEPGCVACARGRTNACRCVAVGAVSAGLQTGYCADTGGGWSVAMVAHRSQVHPVPEAFDDEMAVMVEPAACAIHGVLSTAPDRLDGATVVVVGSGTLGLCTVAALRHFATPAMVMAVAKHPEQRRLAADLGADVVVAPGEVRRAVRRVSGSLMIGDHLAGGADVVIDCVGSDASLADDLAVASPGGEVVLVGMPGHVNVDLTPLWHRQISLRGSYAYGTEARSGLADGPVRTFELAFELVAAARLGRLVSALYPLARYREAIEHAAAAGPRGAVKIAFDLRGEKRNLRSLRTTNRFPQP
ncbi:MAG: zinc-dependent alcohol dehydrogenase [Acidimicrobiales bacterium]